jgi:hypothetical protein
MPDFLGSEKSFSSLSVTDLLAAREQFHFHLMHKANVVGTAIGKYRIRKTDPQPPLPPGPKTPRTLQNSEVRSYSWPAILVFVNQWQDESAFGNSKTLSSSDFVPPAVYMPNGDKVPICVVLATQSEAVDPVAGHYDYPQNLIGGGFPILADVQGVDHVASVGCLVTDGHSIYALTNRHVCGETGEEIYSILNGNRVKIGTSSEKQLTRIPFESAYPGWPATNTYLNLDAGLIKVDDLNRWTTQVYGVGSIGQLADLSTQNLSLRLIGCPVIAYGAASKKMSGEICALFYRYKSVGGSEYLSDFVIGPKSDALSLGTHHGDSGTLWMAEQTAPEGTPEFKLPPLPIALQWGGQVFASGEDGVVSSYSLASSLSTICNFLDVDLVRDWNTGNPDYWGAVGHYSIANRACSALTTVKLKELMTANLENISYDDQYITKKNMQGLSTRDFVPLADVPDMVWKVGPYKRGGMSSPEHGNHFADMDREINPELEPPLPAGATLLDICANPRNVEVKVWQAYYDAVKAQYPGQSESRGLLPFRVWQFYQDMVEFVRQGQVAEFVCAAGIVSHYVGDACQPLHISYLFNGDPDRPVPGQKKDPKTKEIVDVQLSLGTGVHSAYEDDMIDWHTPQVLAGIDAALAQKPRLPIFTGNQKAAVAVVELMRATFGKIKPMDIVNRYVELDGDSPKVAAEALWGSFGPQTIDVMADGCLSLAQIWESAWAEGDGNHTMGNLGAVDQDALKTLYQDPKFMVSKTLDTIGTILRP